MFQYKRSISDGHSQTALKDFVIFFFQVKLTTIMVCIASTHQVLLGDVSIDQLLHYKFTKTLVLLLTSIIFLMSLAICTGTNSTFTSKLYFRPLITL